MHGAVFRDGRDGKWSSRKDIRKYFNRASWSDCEPPPPHTHTHTHTHGSVTVILILEKKIMITVTSILNNAHLSQH